MNNFVDTIHRTFAKQGAVRPEQGRVLGGVCAGIANMFRADANAFRLVFVLTLIFIPGSQILVYPLLWLVMPDAERAGQLLNGTATQAPTTQTTQPTYPAEPTQQAQAHGAAQYPAAGGAADHHSSLSLAK